MMNEPTIGQDEPSMSDLVRTMSKQEDMDSCQIFANTVNTYIDAIKRQGANRELYSDDIMRILQILVILLTAADTERQFGKMAGRKGNGVLRGKPEAVTHE